MRRPHRAEDHQKLKKLSQRPSVCHCFKSPPWSLSSKQAQGEANPRLIECPGWERLITDRTMATSVLPSSVERSTSRRHQQSTPSRSHSTRTKDPDAYGVPPSPARIARQTASRQRAVGESNNNDETVNVPAQTSGRSSSRDRPQHSRSESSRSGHHHHRSGHSRDTMATSVANGGGPAPIVSAQESRPQGKSGKSRTTIPAPSGTFILGKTVSKHPLLGWLQPSPLLLQLGIH